MENPPLVVLAILARDKGHTLPLYLACLENLEYPKRSIALYVRTNNNSDDTIDVLKAWLKRVGHEYESIWYSDEDLMTDPQDSSTWTAERFKVLATIRQASIDYAIKKKAHYFVVDCDNFIMPYTLNFLVYSYLPIVGPMLPLQGERYANYHVKTTDSGYYRETEHHDAILSRNFQGLICVDVIHCTYLIRNSLLDKVSYDDGSERHEYVIFSDILRKHRVIQYLDNRVSYGQLTMARNMDEFRSTIWNEPYFIEQIKKVYPQ